MSIEFSLRLEKVSYENLKKASDFVEVMYIMYTCTLAVASGRASCSEILPIQMKLEKHFRIQEREQSRNKSGVYINMIQSLPIPVPWTLGQK